MNKDYEIDLDDLIGEMNLGDVANVKLPDPSLAEYYIRKRNREILLNTCIYDDFAETYQDIIRWNKEDEGIDPKDRKPIKIYINSDGGVVSAVMAVCDLLIMSKTPVITIGLGKCYSSGGLLLMAGSKRYLLPNCTILIHDGSSGAEGSTGKMMDSLEFTKELEKRVKQYIISRTAITEQTYDMMYRRDWWIFAEDAVRLQIANKIVTDISEIY